MVAQAANDANSVQVSAVREKLETMATFEGAVKQYSPPFTKERHDALWSNDYFMTKFNDKGQLVTTDDR
jgi:branched-chain amino acid transport system substrate-binding protein